jgi:hypothetical protein
VKKEHGCPFVHIHEARNLAKALVEWGGVEPSMAESKIKEIVELARSNNPQLACRKHWELMHPGGNVGDVGNHPNQYVDQSIAYWREKKAGGGGVAAPVGGSSGSVGAAVEGVVATMTPPTTESTTTTTTSTTVNDAGGGEV